MRTNPCWGSISYICFLLSGGIYSDVSVAIVTYSRQLIRFTGVTMPSEIPGLMQTHVEGNFKMQM